MKNSIRVGDVVSIFKYEDRDSGHPSAFGIVISQTSTKTLVKIVYSHTISRSMCVKNVVNGCKRVYEVSGTDRIALVVRPSRAIYRVSPSKAVATKIISTDEEVVSSSTYLKCLPGSETEVYLSTFCDKFIPKFLMMRDVTNDISQVVVYNNESPDLNRLAKEAYYRIQVVKYGGQCK